MNILDWLKSEVEKTEKAQGGDDFTRGYYRGMAKAYSTVLRECFGCDISIEEDGSYHLVVMEINT